MMTMAGMKRRYRDKPTNWERVGQVVFGIAFIFAAVMLVLGVRHAHGHDHNRPDLADWYKALRTDSGPCCDGSDSTAIEEPGAVLPGPNLDGRTLVWPYTSGGVLTVRCFLRGLET